MPVLSAACPVTPPPAWHAEAACKGLGHVMDPPTWLDAQAVQEARDVCAPCPVRHRCWAWAVQQPALTGIAAGLTENQRSMLRGHRMAVIRTDDGKKECGTCGRILSMGWFPVEPSYSEGRGRNCRDCVKGRRP